MAAATAAFEEISNVEFETSEGVEVIDQFTKMHLKKKLVEEVIAYGFEKPSAIQQRAIKTIIKKKEVIVQGQPGAGKTAALAISIVHLVDTRSRKTQVVCLSSTKDSALQMQQFILALGNSMNVRCHAFIGGNDIKEDRRKLASGQHVVCGTPGRVLNMIKERAFRAPNVKMLVLDEADEMSKNGSSQQIYEIKRLCAPTHVFIISVTQAKKIEKIVSNPIFIRMKGDKSILEGMKQFYVAVEHEERKLQALRNIHDILNQVIIFCNSKQRVILLAKKMREQNVAVSSMHGDMPLKERDNMMKEFQSKQSRALIATDVLTRDIVFQDLLVVLNYDFPDNRELYIRRVGRSDRFGRKVLAINFVKPDENRLLRDIEEYYSTKIVEMPPNVADWI